MSYGIPATPAQLAELKLLVPRIAELINEDQLDTLAANLDEPIKVGTVEQHRDIPMRELLQHMVGGGDITTENLINLVRHINFKRLGPRIDHAIDISIATQGYAVQPVFGENDGTPAYAYTLGLNFKTGFELIVSAGQDIHLLTTVLSKYAELALQSENIELERNDLAYMRTHAKYGVRTKCVPVDFETVKQSHSLCTRGEVKCIYQILIADKNNLFPNESGYDPEWAQPDFSKPLN
ncbi:hypothetical protein D3C81_176790 [compost metagenome]